jgi:hypothetical protein
MTILHVIKAEWHDTPWTVKGAVIFAVVLLLMV